MVVRRGRGIAVRKGKSIAADLIRLRFFNVPDDGNHLATRPSRSQIFSEVQMPFRMWKGQDGAQLGHEDGWGILSYRNNSPEYLGRSTEPAWKNGEYRLDCEKITNRTELSWRISGRRLLEPYP